MSIYYLRYCASTLRGVYTILKGFYLHSGQGLLELHAPIIEVMLKKWARTEQVKVSRIIDKSRAKEWLKKANSQPNDPIGETVFRFILIISA